MSPAPHVVVAGAGPAGLYAAKTLLELGARVTVLEKEDRPGGLASADQVRGNSYEGGVHHLHANDAPVFEEISRLMGARLLPVEKSARIRFGDGFRAYPLEFADLLRAMPALTLLACSGGLVLQQLRNRLGTRRPANGEEALIQLYGKPLYRVFFRDFTHQYWGLHPTELSATFVQKKMPRLSAFEGIRKALRGLLGQRPLEAEVERATSRETLYYTSGGAHEIFEALAGEVRRLGGELRFVEPLAEVRIEDGAVVSVATGSAEVAQVDSLVSTIPLPVLIEAIAPSPPRAEREAASRLGYKPLTVLALVVRRERVLDSLYVYFRDRAFHRIGEPKNSGLRVAPADHTMLVAELTRPIDIGDPEQCEATVQQVIADLARDGMLTGREEVADFHFLHRTHAYPVFRRGFEEELDRVRRYLAGIRNLVSTGRQGAFAYPNMHQAMRMGCEAAKEALASLRASR